MNLQPLKQGWCQKGDQGAVDPHQEKFYGFGGIFNEKLCSNAQKDTLHSAL